MLLKLAETALALTLPIAAAALIDRAIPSGSAARIIRMGFTLAGLGLAQLACAAASQHFTNVSTVKLQRAVSRRMQNRSRNSLRHLTRDIRELQDDAELALELFLHFPCVILGAVLAALLIHARCALILAGATAVFAGIIFGIPRLSHPARLRARIRLDEVSLRTRENLAGAHVLRAYKREDDEIDEFNRIHEQLTRAHLSAGNVEALARPLTCAAASLAIIALLYAGAPRIDAGMLSRGKLIALMLYLYQILAELIRLSEPIRSEGRIASCRQHIRALFSTRPKQQHRKDMSA